MEMKSQEEEWKMEQEAMKLEMNRDCSLDLESIQYIGGVDISFYPNSNDACATLVVLSYPELKVICEASCHTTLTLPYIPTFLAFREIPALLPLFDLIPSELKPQLLFVDGNGELHPRGFGIASHLGVVTSIPSIGVAKTFLNVDGLTKKNVRALVHTAKEEQRGMDNSSSTVIVELRGESGKIWGQALCTEGIENPIYISIGNLISLRQSVEMVQQCSLYRVPEPIRQADLRSRAIIREWGRSGIDYNYKKCHIYKNSINSQPQ